MPSGNRNVARIRHDRTLEIASGLRGSQGQKEGGQLRFCCECVIATPTSEDHVDWLDEVFGCMKRAGLKCKPSKCEILRDSIKYLGRMVDKHGVRPDPEAVEAVLIY